MNLRPAWHLVNGIGNATDDELEESSESCERWGWICGGLIVAGIIAEFIIAAIDPPYGSFWERWGTACADAFVALGVAGEIMFSRMGFRRQKELATRSEEHVAQLELHAGHAEERAARAELEAGQLKSQMAWRSLSSEQIAILDAQLNSIHSASLEISFFGQDPESQNFAKQIGEAFHRAGWLISFNACSYAGDIIFGLRVPDGSGDNDWATSKKVQTALEFARIEFVRAPTPDWFAASTYGDASGPKCAQMYVGPKPMPQP